MEIVLRANIRQATQAIQTLATKAITWARKAAIYDAVKFVDVPQCMGHNTRNIMTRVLTDGRIELWINIADAMGHRPCSVGELKRHLANPETREMVTRLRTRPVDRVVRLHRGRNQTEDRVQLSSRSVHLTIDERGWSAKAIARCMASVTGRPTRGASFATLMQMIEGWLREMREWLAVAFVDEFLTNRLSERAFKPHQVIDPEISDKMEAGLPMDA